MWAANIWQCYKTGAQFCSWSTYRGLCCIVSEDSLTEVVFMCNQTWLTHLGDTFPGWDADMRAAVFPHGLSCLPVTVHQTVRAGDAHADWQARRLTPEHMDVWASCWADRGTSWNRQKKLKDKKRSRFLDERNREYKSRRCIFIDIKSALVFALEYVNTNI